MKKLMIVLMMMLMMVSVASAATLKWSAVQNTDKVTIEGYRVFWSTSKDTPDEEKWSKTIGNTTQQDLSVLNLEYDVEYWFFVNAYSTTKKQGPLSEGISYIMKRPDFIDNPKDTVIEPVVLKVGGLQITVESDTQ